MSIDVTVAVILFFGNISILGLLEDYQNPTDFAKDMNRVYPIELILQGTLFTLQAFNVIMVFSLMQLLLLCIHTAYFGYHIKLYLDNKWKVDAALVWSHNFKQKMKKTIFAGLAFAGVCFFLYLYNVFRRLKDDGQFNPEFDAKAFLAREDESGA